MSAQVSDHHRTAKDKPDYKIVHHSDAGQWEVRLVDPAQPDGLGKVIGYASYDFLDHALLFTHTVVMREYQGYGIASALIRTALEEIRSEGKYCVVPICSYVQSFIDKHPEYQELLPQKAMAPGLHFGE